MKPPQQRFKRLFDTAPQGASGGFAMMRHICFFAAAMVAVAGCGTDANSVVSPLSPDTSVSVTDGGNTSDTQPDSSSTSDAAVDNDVPVAIVDASVSNDAAMPTTDVAMVIDGVGPMIMNGPFRCAARLCHRQTITSWTGVMSDQLADVTCNSAHTEAELSGIGFTWGDGWTTCRGNTCFMPVSGTVIQAIVYSLVGTDDCSTCGTIVRIDTATGQQIPLTEGYRQSCQAL